MNKFHAFQTFVTAAEQGSFTAAARKLGTSASTVTKMISRLEDDLSVRLFNRTTRQLALTDQGQALFERARSILAEVEEAENLLRRTTTATRGTVRIVVPNLFGRLYFVPSLPEFYRRHPEVALQINFSDKPLDLIEEGFDLAVHTGELADSSIVRRLLTQGPTVTAASPEYLVEHGTPQVPEDLLNHNCINGRFGLEWMFKTPQGGRQRLQLTGNTAIFNGDSLREAAVQGVGVIHATWWAVRKDIHAGRLVRILQDYELPGRAISVVFPSRRHLPARVRAVIDYLVEITADAS